MIGRVLGLSMLFLLEFNDDRDSAILSMIMKLIL